MDYSHFRPGKTGPLKILFLKDAGVSRIRQGYRIQVLGVRCWVLGLMLKKEIFLDFLPRPLDDKIIRKGAIERGDC